MLTINVWTNHTPNRKKRKKRNEAMPSGKKKEKDWHRKTHTLAQQGDGTVTFMCEQRAKWVPQRPGVVFPKKESPGASAEDNI